jgi:hypothetical protein
MEEAQGTIRSLIKRRVQATTTCFAFAPPQTTTTSSRNPSGGGDPGFAVRLTCRVTMYIRAGHGQKVRSYRGGAGAEASCLAVPDDEDGVRDALRGMLRSVRALQDLGLTDGEWESIVPEDVVPKLADPQERARHGAAEVDLAVVQHVRFDPATVLMTGCKKIGDEEEEGGVDDVECSVCFDALLRLRGEAVELPGCAHAFHRRCISKWFRRNPTCPLCRGDVVKHLDPELQKQIAEFTEDAM